MKRFKERPKCCPVCGETKDHPHLIENGVKWRKHISHFACNSIYCQSCNDGTWVMTSVCQATPEEAQQRNPE